MQHQDHEAPQKNVFIAASSDSKRNVFGARTAENSAGFLRPYLKPGMRLLDCGCGPGSITLGLAAMVAPGETIGIDSDPGSIDLSRKLAAEQGSANVRFEVADVNEIPFPDASFDVVFSHAVLLHLRNPIRALKEMRRVLKQGGLIGIRNDDMDGMLMVPPDSLLEQGWALMEQVMQRNGGNIRGAKHSRAWLREGGFTRTELSASYEYYGTLAATAWWSGIRIQVLRSIQESATELGLTDPATIERICAAWHEWGTNPDAFFGKAWCEAIGWVD
ncbi:MAG: class I SAM-dependent methyltransferase [Caldilineaceae bacterium]